MPEPNLCTLSLLLPSKRKESISSEVLFPTSGYFSCNRLVRNAYAETLPSKCRLLTQSSKSIFQKLIILTFFYLDISDTNKKDCLFFGEAICTTTPCLRSRHNLQLLLRHNHQHRLLVVVVLQHP